MKYLFGAIAVLLLLASVLVWADLPGVRADRRALIYWTTDPNPARKEQVRLFDEYQRRIGLVEEDGTPMIALELDTGNGDPTKKVIQSVSGVAGDTMDLYGGRDARFFNEMGVLVDVTEAGEKLGFSPDTTFDAALPEVAIEIGGEWRQFLYPANFGFNLYYVNVDTFRELGLEPPAGRMTIERFEELGREFVARANPGQVRFNRKFFADVIQLNEFRRSFGIDTYNETLTDTLIDTPEGARALEYIRKWTLEDRLLPTQADRESFASAGGYAGGSAELIERGQIGMLRSGRWMLIRFRQTNVDRVEAGLPPLNFQTVEPPTESYRSIEIAARAAGVYTDGRRTVEDLTLSDGTVVPAGTPWAVFFLAFLASPEYNEQIIADADGLPGNPAYATGDAYFRPTPDPELGIYPQTEYDVHGPHLRAAEEIADAITNSPYVLRADAERDENQQRDAYMIDPPGFPSAQAAMDDAAARIRKRIQDNLQARPELQARYEAAMEDQREIDRLKAAGQPIPASLIRNPFYLRYYQEQGLLLDDDSSALTDGDRSE